MKKVFLIVLSFVCFPLFLYPQEKKVVKLTVPRISGGMSLMQALSGRKSTREFSKKELPLDILSDLLWAANGINRVKEGLTTAPSTMNMQEIDIYVAKADGLFLYNAKDNTLEQVSADDVRAVTGKQPFVKDAPVNFIFVANMDKMDKVEEKDRLGYAGMDAAFISQNVYLFCAANKLATVVRGWFDAVELSQAMKLKSTQKPILTQTVGYFL